MSGVGVLVVLGCVLAVLGIVAGLLVWPLPARPAPAPAADGLAVPVILPRALADRIDYPDRARMVAEQAAFADIAARFHGREEATR